jgi:ribonucleoside-diphosphate reductase beta chain
MLREKKSGLLTGNPIYKPFRYPWCYDAWLTQQRIHWLPEEVPMADDVRDWQKNITPAERNLLTQIFRFFTQADVEVNNYYMGHCMHVFKPTEVKMMLSVFSAMETVHMAAYAHLLDTIGLPETEYAEFLKLKLCEINMITCRDVNQIRFMILLRLLLSVVPSLKVYSCLQVLLYY